MTLLKQLLTFSSTKRLVTLIPRVYIMTETLQLNGKRPTPSTAPPQGPQTKKPKIRKYKAKSVDPTSPLGVLQYEIDDLLKENGLERKDIYNDVNKILNDKEGTVTKLYHRVVSNVSILKLSSSGDGLALVGQPSCGEEKKGKQVAVVPFGLPGDTVNIRVYKTHPYYVECDLLDVIDKGPLRKDELIRDKYFGKVSGSQFEFLSYDDQLDIKRNTIANAYRYFAPRLTLENLVPSIGDTIGSPEQYGYRTKITPHFDLLKKAKGEGIEKERPPLGFNQRGRPTWRKETLELGGHAPILDIESCSLATKILNIGLTNERRRFAKEYKNYKRGATILLRENTILYDSTKNIEEQLGEGSRDDNGNVSYLEVEDKSRGVRLLKTCVTDPKQTVTEYVDGYMFSFTAGEFFQNNNSILPLVTKYVRDNLQIPASDNEKETDNYLVDAYCGCGLFSICCSASVSKVIGVEISAVSVAFAERNAKANNIANCRFIVGKAEKLFESIDTPNDRTSVILDPPRKGCDEVFLKQLAEYYPRRIVYVSCNVHSQARDVEYFLKETENGSHYKIESIRGFDFFPQTHHVESVCVLSRD